MANTNDYTYEFNSFPKYGVMTHRQLLDVTNDIMALVNTCYAAMDAGNYTQAKKIISDNADTLGRCVIDCALINEYAEQLRNTQIYAKQAKQSVTFADALPDNAIADDVYIIASGGAEE